MIKATVRCPYCEAVCVLQGTEREFITCFCEATWIARYPDGDSVHVGVKFLVGGVDAVPVPDTPFTPEPTPQERKIDAILEIIGEHRARIEALTKTVEAAAAQVTTLKHEITVQPTMADLSNPAFWDGAIGRAIAIALGRRLRSVC